MDSENFLVESSDLSERSPVHGYLLLDGFTLTDDGNRGLLTITTHEFTLIYTHSNLVEFSRIIVCRFVISVATCTIGHLKW